MPHKTYNCELTGYSIKYEIEDNYALMDCVNCDYVYPKAFASLLRTSIDDLQANGIKIIKQYVYKNDYDENLKNKTKWSMQCSPIQDLGDNNSNDTDILLLSCSIDDFLENIAIGLGII